MSSPVTFAELVGRLTLDASDFKQGMDGLNKDVEKGSSRLGKAGRGIGSSIMKNAKRAIAVGGGGAALVGGLAIKKGFDRLLGIENAQAKLRGLGHDAANVKGIMDDALKSVKGTAFGMDEAATTAAGAVAAGIKPGQELTKYLKLTADAATIAGTSMGEMGSIINKVTTSGKAQADNLNQLADRGIPIFQWLAEEYGVSADELSTMVRKGQVDSATFRKVIEENIGGAALESGKTTAGAWKNMQASLGRIGANLLSGIFPKLQGGIVGLTNVFAGLEEKAKPVGEAIGNALSTAIGHLKTLTSGVDGSAVSELLTGMRDAALSLAPAVKEVVGQLAANFANMLPNIIEFGQHLSSAFADAGPGLAAIGVALVPLLATFGELAAATAELALEVAGPLLGALGSLIGVVGDFASNHGTAFRAIVTSIIALHVAWRAAAIASSVAASGGMLKVIAGTRAVQAAKAAAAPFIWAFNGALTAGSRAALGTRIQLGLLAVQTRAVAAASAAAGVASKVGAVGMRLLGVAVRFALGPVGLIIAAVVTTALVIRHLWRTNETFRKVVIGVWNSVKSAVGKVVDWFKSAPAAAFKAVRWAFLNMTPVGQVIKNFDRIVGGAKAIKGKIVGFFKGAGGWLIGAGKRLISGLIKGLKDMLPDVGGAMGKVAGKIKGFLPGSPVKEGPLTSWNGGGAGKRLVSMLADGLSDVGPVTDAMRALSAATSGGYTPAFAGSTFGASSYTATAARTPATARAAGTVQHITNVTVDIPAGTTAADGAAITGYVETAVEKAFDRLGGRTTARGGR